MYLYAYDHGLGGISEQGNAKGVGANVGLYLGLHLSSPSVPVVILCPLPEGP